MRMARGTFLFVLLCVGIAHSQDATPGRSMYVPPAKSQHPAHNGSAVRTPLRVEESLSDTARLEWVRHLSSNSASGVDIATDVVIDNRGSVYVTGKSESEENGRNYLTIKYDTHGLELWRAEYDGPAHADDVPVAVAIDASGNTYVTGMSMELVHGYATYQYATVKYNASGQEQWVARSSDPSNEGGDAAAIAVDAVGNVVITGESYRWDSSGNTDFATIKYSSEGVQLWEARSGSSDSADVAHALTIDDSGNVYVTGGSCAWGDMGYYSSVKTIKYNPDGTEQWSVITPGDSNGFLTTIGIAVDNAGSVYVSGTANLSWQGSSYIFTEKFNSMGQQQWIRAYHDSTGSCLARSLAVDSFGNVTILGDGSRFNWPDGNFFLTVRYNSSGSLLWAGRYSEPQFGLLVAGDLAVDNAGNAYVTGSGSPGFSSNTTPPFMLDSIVTIKYDINGVVQRVQHYNGQANSKSIASAIAVNQAGTIAVAGGSGPTNGSDFVVIKYQSSGTKEWDARASEEGYSFESLSAMTVDTAGNVYVTGSSLDPNSSHDYFTAKFNAAGSQLWLARYNGPANGPDFSNAIALDAAGNIYVTGSSKGVGTSQDWATIKYNSLGIEQWVARYNGVTNQDDEASLITVDSALNIYVAGATASGARMTTIKYNSSGQQQWAASYDSAYSYTSPNGLCVDKNGNVYVAKPRSYWADGVVFKYNGLGGEEWRAPGADDILVDDSANVYVSSSYLWTRKYNSTATLIWQVATGGARMEFDQVGDILIQNPYGTSICKITRLGVLQWSCLISVIYPAFGFCVDGTGNSYVSGTPWEVYPGAHSAKVSPTGSVHWLTKYSTENSILKTQACQVDASGNLYVAGTSERDDFSNAVTILKYGQVTVSVKEEAPSLPESYSLSQNYPNPFNPSTTVQFAIPKSGNVQLKIYNTLGQEVATLVNEEKVAGAYSLQWNAGSVASGVYFYQLQAGDYRETKKLLLMK